MKWSLLKFIRICVFTFSALIFTRPPLMGKITATKQFEQFKISVTCIHCKHPLCRLMLLLLLRWLLLNFCLVILYIQNITIHTYSSFKQATEHTSLHNLHINLSALQLQSVYIPPDKHVGLVAMAIS